jgi:hypothetical protein
MVEYGGGIANGPAGQVAGGSGLGDGGSGLFASVGQLVNDVATTASNLSPVELVIVAVAVILGLVILRRAF